MTVPAAVTTYRYEGNGVTTVFAYNNRLLTTADVKVQILTRSTDAVVETLTLTTDYTVTIVSNSLANITITNAAKIPSGTQDILLSLDIAISQARSYPRADSLPAGDVEKGLDKLTLIAQTLNDDVSRSLRFPDSDTTSSGTLPPKADRLGKFLGFGSVNGEPIATDAPSGLVTTAFGSSLVQAANATAGRTVIGAAASGANTDITSLEGLTSINDGQIGGFRNGVINGAFDIWQRGTTFTPAMAVVAYTADRWVVKRDTAAAYTVSRQTGPDGSLYCARVQRDNLNASTDPIYFAQGIRTSGSQRYRGKKATIRFKARKGANYSASSSALSVLGYYGTGTDQGPFSYTGQTTIISGSATLTTSWQTFTFTSAAAVSTSANQIGFYFTFVPTGTAAANDYYEISEVEFVEGNTGDTYFERLDFMTVLNQCMASYEKSFPYATAPAQNAGVTGATCVQLPTGASGTFGTTIQMAPKYAAPTIVTYNPSAANANWRDTTGGADRTVTVGTIGDSSFLITGAAGVAGTTNRIHYAAESELV